MYSKPYDPNAEKTSVKYEIYDWVESAVFAVMCMVLILMFIGRIVWVDGSSMEPTLHNGDRLISSRLFYTPDYGDIVVITQPNPKNEPLIKRVIATEGQVVDIDFKTGIVSVDGNQLLEPYTKEPTYSKYDVDFPIEVPQGHVFVMGDNRNDSWDSRDSAVGMVDERYILGRVVLRLMPFEDFGKLDKPEKP